MRRPRRGASPEWVCRPQWRWATSGGRFSTCRSASTQRPPRSAAEGWDPLLTPEAGGVGHPQCRTCLKPPMAGRPCRGWLQPALSTRARRPARCRARCLPARATPSAAPRPGRAQAPGAAWAPADDPPARSSLLAVSAKHQRGRRRARGRCYFPSGDQRGPTRGRWSAAARGRDLRSGPPLAGRARRRRPGCPRSLASASGCCAARRSAQGSPGMRHAAAHAARARGCANGPSSPSGTRPAQTRSSAAERSGSSPAQRRDEGAGKGAGRSGPSAQCTPGVPWRGVFRTWSGSSNLCPRERGRQPPRGVSRRRRRAADALLALTRPSPPSPPP